MIFGFRETVNSIRQEKRTKSILGVIAVFAELISRGIFASLSTYDSSQLLSFYASTSTNFSAAFSHINQSIESILPDTRSYG